MNVMIEAEETNEFEIYADKLSSINVFKGTSNGFELDRSPTRLEGLVMLIRLLGKEDDALVESNMESVFTDVPSWGIPYTNYAFKNGLSKGIGNNIFGADQSLDAQSYHTFLLRALGYDDSMGDFNWNEANAFALEKGIIGKNTYNDLQTKPLLRRHLAQSSYVSLFINKKDTEKTLINTLVESGDIDATVANQLEISDSQVKIIDLDKEAEYVKIQNKGSQSIDIGGWTMVSEKGYQTFVFPTGYVLEPNQICTLTSGKLKDTGDFMMAATTIWNNSDSDNGILLDSSGSEVSRWVD